MELSEQAKSLIKDEIDKRSSKLNGIMHEVKLWLWIVRLVFLIILGGSVYGLVKVDDYVDAKITARVSQLDKLPIALAEANAGDFDQATATMDDLWTDIYKNKVKVSEEFEVAFLSNYAWILASVVYSPSQEQDYYWAWIRNQWVRLNKNERFIRLKADLTDDITFQKSMALMNLKIAPSIKSVDVALRRIKSLIKNEDSPVDKSYLYYDLALLYLLKNDIETAALNIKNASDLHPDMFHVDDWEKYKASYIGEQSFEMWKFVAFELDIFDLDSKLGEAFYLVVKKSNKEFK